MAFDPSYLTTSDPGSFSVPMVKMPRTSAQEAQDVADLQANSAKIAKFAADIQAQRGAEAPQAVEWDRQAGTWLRKDGMPLQPGDFPVVPPVIFQNGDLSAPEAVAKTTAHLMEVGLSPGTIDQAINLTPVTAHERLAVQNWKARAMKDPVFVKAFLAGEPEQVRLMTCADIALSCPIRED